MRTGLLSLLLSLVLACSVSAAEIHLSVAASMTEATKALITAYQQQQPQVDFFPNFAASGALAKQIAQGAPTDLFISANSKWMNYLVDEGRVSAKQVRTFASNALVVVGRPEIHCHTLAALAQLQRIAIGSPQSVPAGQYSVQALRAAGLYTQLESKLVMAQNVRQALLYADRGEADAAFVYRTDALLAQQATILFEVPQELYDKVTYPVGLTVEGESNPAAVAFFAFLKSEQATAILQRFGFVVH